VAALIDGEPAFRRICEAVEAARKRVWLTVAFVEADCPMPDGRGSVFDVLDRAAARGVDVRVLFWDDPAVDVAECTIFPAHAASHAYLSERGSRLRARWDRVAEHCHHQKSWVVDAGEAGETAFVGGINIDRPSITAPGHAGGARYLHYEGIHDVYLEVCGPAATDVAHNFVQRWNGASARGERLGAYPNAEDADDLPFPVLLSRAAGDAVVQVSRSILPGLYRNGPAAPDAAGYEISAGEFSIGEQYLAAIEAAREAIYLENQILLCPGLFAALEQALGRGVEVVAVMPKRAMPEIARYRDHPLLAPIIEALGALGRHDNFTMAALAVARDGGTYADVYVHSKVAIVDDGWATVGSANAMFRSWRGDTEMNASFWHAGQARDLRERLFGEHVGTAAIEGPPRRVLRAFAETARDNARRLAEREPLVGLAHAIEPSAWIG
jgi:phosphatidylserine/phosphatidylglycerophosphate/cardiolipin synthase-like enzyme